LSNGDESSLFDLQASALLETLRADRERRCRAELDAAAERARSIERAARAEARAKFAAARELERQRYEQALQRARAAVDTRLRERAHASGRALVASAWQQLPAALVRQWQDAGGRAHWIRRAVQEARRRLRGTDWQVEHAPGLTDAERRQCVADGAPAARFAEDPALDAGLRIRAEGAVLDATVAGLLADRERVTAGLLAVLERTPPS
jgi:hypothetical protein